MEALVSLREAGVTVRQVDRPSVQTGDQLDAVIDATIGEVSERFVVDVKARAPHPNEVDHLAARLHRTEDLGEPMVVAPYVSTSVGDRLTAAGVSWADGCGNFDLRTPVLVCRQRMSNSPPTKPRTSLPQGSGSLGIIRSLIGLRDSETDEYSATALAVQAGVTQPRASQVLHQLLDLGLVERTRSRRWLPHRGELLDRFLTDYRGPGDSERFLYSLDPPAEVAVAAASVRAGRIAVSADVGPDLISPWRRPSIVVIYADAEIETRELGAVDAAGPDDANVILRIPSDRSVFPNPSLITTYRETEIPLADPTQQIWDLVQLGGADRLEAADHLRTWLLTGR